MLKTNMTPLGRVVLESIVEPAIKNNNAGGKGRVLSYDYIKKLAVVETTDQATANTMIFENVKVEDHGRGVEMVALKPGTEVWISFQGQSNPTITTIFSERTSEADIKVHNGHQIPRYMDGNAVKARQEEVSYKTKLVEVDNGFNDVTNNIKFTQFQEDETALHHWNNKSVIRICDDGCIDSFVGETVGIRLDPNAKSTNVFAPNVNIFGNKTNILTNPNGLIWNSWQFNPSIYTWCDRAPLSGGTSPRNFKLKCDYEVLEDGAWKHKEVLIPPYLKNKRQESYSKELQAIVKQLGLPL